MECILPISVSPYSMVAESISIGYPSSGAIATLVDSKSDIRIVLIRSSYLVLASVLNGVACCTCGSSV
jgi:hypothetical protein